MTSAEGLQRKAEVLKPAFDKLKKKGVRIRIATTFSKEAEDVIKDLSNYAEIRNIKDVNARFCIVDGKELTFMVMNDKEVHPTYDLGIWVNTPYFATAMENLFEQSWEKAGKSK